MQTKNLAELYELPTIPWSTALEALEKDDREGLQNGTNFLATAGSDGHPHMAGVGAIWDDGKVYVVSGQGTLKSRHLAENPHCAISMSLKGIDLTIEGRAERVTDKPTLERMAKRYGDTGWPARVEGEAFTYDYSAPSAGPPPWNLYAITPTSIVGVMATAPGGATLWRFDESG